MTYFNRAMSNLALKLAAQYPILTLLGPRQSGKTTLVKKLFPNKPYISFENLDTIEFAKTDPRSFLSNYPEGAIFDEIQRAPWILSYIQSIVDDTNIKGMYILTGSHQLALHQSVSQSLAGRTAILKLLPLSLDELSPEHQHKEVDFYLFHGMYPRVYHDNLDPYLFYSSYMQTYIERDVRQMINIKNLSLFQTFIKLCAGRIGQILNVHSLSNDLGVSSHTIEQWLSILEASFVIYRLQPYYENFGKRMIKSPKLYFYDVGLASYCLNINQQSLISRDPLRGALVENCVINEIIKQRYNQGIDTPIYFYRDSNQNEIDVIINKGHCLIPIEIKASKTFSTHFLTGINRFKTLIGDRYSKGYLIYTGDMTQTINDIEIINILNIPKMLQKAMF